MFVFLFTSDIEVESKCQGTVRDSYRNSMICRVSNYLQSWTYLPLSSLAKIGESILAVHKKRKGKCASLYPDYVCLSVAFVFVIKAEIKTTVMLWMHKEIQRKHRFLLVYNRKKELAGFSGQEVQYACRCARFIPRALTSCWILLAWRVPNSFLPLC